MEEKEEKAVLPGEHFETKKKEKRQTLTKAIYWNIFTLRKCLWDKSSETQEDLKVAPRYKESEYCLLKCPQNE